MTVQDGMEGLMDIHVVARSRQTGQFLHLRMNCNLNGILLKEVAINYVFPRFDRWKI